MEIDTELANQEIFENYANQYVKQDTEQQDDEVIKDPSEESPKSDLLDDSDALKDKGARKFLDALKKIGPHSKHILNYSYPPLLYQRGDDEEEDEESQDQGECDEDDESEVQNSNGVDEDGMGQLPEFHDSDDDELIALGGALAGASIHNGELDDED